MCENNFMNKKTKILIVDDEKPQQKILKLCFEKRGFDVYTASSGEEGFEIFKKVSPQIVLTDMRMGTMTGLELLKKIKEISFKTEIIVITAYGEIEVAVEALKSGAADFILKPVNLENLLQAVNNAITRLEIMDPISKSVPTKNLSAKNAVDKIITENSTMLNMLETAKLVAASDATVIIRGESGTGKELLAQVIQENSNRSRQPFVVVNCAALNENLLESELFGHCKGAFTSAVQDRMGRFEEANTGTLFLDEIGDLPLGTQVKLLRALQEGEIQKVGENKTIKVDVRVIAATNQNLERMMTLRTFRSDLYYRLNVITLELPELKNRKDDIPVLAEYFLQSYAKKLSRENPKISEEALNSLKSYSFPGNIRELENIIQRALVMTPGNIIKEINFSANNTTENEESEDNMDFLDNEEGLDSLLERVEHKKITKALAMEKYDIGKTADRLNISLRQLRYRIKKLGIK